MSDYQRIRTALKRVRRTQGQRRLMSVSMATLWASAGLVAVSAVVLGLYYSRALHTTVLGFWIAAVAALWILQFALPALRERRDANTARLLERHHGDLRNDITSSLQFGSVLESQGAESAQAIGSPDLMRAIVSRTADRLAKPGALARRLPDYRVAWIPRAGIACLAVLAVLGLAKPDLVSRGATRMFVGPEAVASSAGLAARGGDPLIGRITVTYQYPSYTHREPFRMANPSGRIDVLIGTEVTLDALALEDAERASLILRSESAADDAAPTEIDMQVAGRDLSVAFTPMQDASYTFELVDPDGKERVDPIERSIRVIPDTAPQVELMAPDNVVAAAPGDVVLFRFAVADDFGLTELAFVHAFAGDADHERRDTLITLDGDVIFEDNAGFDLGPLALQPHDELLVYVEAVDNDTIRGPKAGRSRPVLVRITSPEDRHRVIIERQEQLYEALLQVLGDYLENPIADMSVQDGRLQFRVPELRPDEYAPRYRAAMHISGRVLEVLGDMRDLLDMMDEDELLLRRDFDLIESMYERLYELHRVEQNVLTSLGRAASRGTLNRHHMDRVEDVRRQQVEATEDAILTLEELVASQRMESLVRTLEELDQIQSRLRELLTEYQQTEDPELRAEIERELLRLEARMRELLQRLAEQMQNLPSEHYNVEALEEMGMIGDIDDMTDALQRIRQMLDSGDIEGALQALDDLSAQVESMLQQMSESMDSGGGGISELDQRVAELMEQLNDLEAQESEIEHQTEALQEEIRQRRIEEVRQELESIISRAREQVAQMQRELGEIDADALRSDLTEDIAEADDMLSEVDERLTAEDIVGALEGTEALIERLANTGYQLERSAGRRSDTPGGDLYRRSGESVGSVQGQAEGLASELSQLIERARPRPGAEDAAQLESLAESQRATSEHLEALRQRVSEMGQEMPLLEQELGPPLDEVGNAMRGASGQLDREQLSPALNHERQALQQLRQLREQMHQMVARERMGRRNSGQVSRERVEIPEEPDETPAEFRQDILDAMRDGSLESYREAIRQYYESLVE